MLMSLIIYQNPVSISPSPPPLFVYLKKLDLLGLCNISKVSTIFFGFGQYFLKNELFSKKYYLEWVGKLSFSFSYLSSHEIELFSLFSFTWNRVVFHKILVENNSRSHSKLNKENYEIIFLWTIFFEFRSSRFLRVLYQINFLKL